MTASDRHLVTGGGILVILLLLLWWKVGGGRDTLFVHDKPVTIGVDLPPVMNYDLPPLVIPRAGGPWDWMQTTDLGCGCDAGLWKQPMEITPAPQLPQSYPVYRYVTQTEYTAGPTYNFPVYVAPPLPTWWYVSLPGYIDRYKGPYLLQGIETSDGQRFATSKRYSMGAAVQMYNAYTLSGSDLYAAGKRFVHDPAKDKIAPPVPVTYAFSTG